MSISSLSRSAPRCDTSVSLRMRFSKVSSRLVSPIRIAPLTFPFSRMTWVLSNHEAGRRSQPQKVSWFSTAQWSEGHGCCVRGVLAIATWDVASDVLPVLGILQVQVPYVQPVPGHLRRHSWTTARRYTRLYVLHTRRHAHQDGHIIRDVGAGGSDVAQGSLRRTLSVHFR